jgi:hypothetical protein
MLLPSVDFQCRLIEAASVNRQATTFTGVNRDGLQSQDSSAGMWPNIIVQRRQCTQSPQALPSGRFILSALLAERG